jgi:branched-chain amino acid aminotransferase
VAEAGTAIVGLIGASWQVAIRVPGSYGLIQELWVHPDWRGCGVGRALIDDLCERARSRGVACVEVGLPGSGYADAAATERFYAENDFSALGRRMRRRLT